MDIIDLKYIIEVNRACSISKAANNLFISQPNLSKAITNLEAEVGSKIFLRTPQGVVPTEEGKSFINYAQTIISQFDELQSMFKPNQHNNIRFNISMPRATYISVALANYLSTIDEETGISVNIKETNSLQTIQNVFSGESDIGIIRFQNNTEEYFLNLIRKNNLTSETLFQYKLQVLMSKNHPLANHDEIMYHELLPFTEIVHGDIVSSSISYNNINYNTSKQQERRIYVYERGSQFEILKRLQTSYMWVSPIPDDVLEQNGLVTIDCNISEHTNKDVLICSSKHTLNSYETDFINEVKKTFKKIK